MTHQACQLATALALVTSSACRDEVGPDRRPRALPTVRDLVTPELAEAIGADGLFKKSVFENPNAVGISATRARQLASAFLKTHGEGFRRTLEKDHGGSIAISSLQPCGRAYVAESPYQLSAELPDWLQRVFGSWWLITFCGGEVRQVSIAVSSRSEAIDVSPEGLLLYPLDGTAYFYPLGIPRSIGELPLEPERAASAIASLSGRRMIRVPRLIAPAVGKFPQFARWESAIGAATTIQIVHAGNTRGTRSASTIYHGLELFVSPPLSYTAAEQQPASTAYHYSIEDADGKRRPAVVHVRRRPDMPLAFDTIVGRSSR